MRTLIFVTLTALISGCAAPPAVENEGVTPAPVREDAPREEPARDPLPDITAVPATGPGRVVKIRGTAYIHDVEDEGFITLRQGDPVPPGKIFFLEPKTTTRIAQEGGDDIFLYSKDHAVYYILEVPSP